LITIKSLASSSRGNCYWISDGITPILIECGIPFKEIQKGTNFEISIIGGCLVSHSHKDHCKSVKDILKAGIDVYMSEETTGALMASGDIIDSVHRVNVIQAKKEFKIGSWVVLPFDLIHDVENLGFLLQDQSGEKLVYITDTAYCKYTFTGLNYIMVECNHSRDILNANVKAGTVPEAMRRRIIKTHFGIEQVKEFLKSNDLLAVNEIHLLHLSEGNSDEARFKREIQALTGKMVKIAKA